MKPVEHVQYLFEARRMLEDLDLDQAVEVLMELAAFRARERDIEKRETEQDEREADLDEREADLDERESAASNDT